MHKSSDTRTNASHGSLSSQALVGSQLTTLLVEAALDAVVVLDSAGFVRGWNRQAEAMFGWTKDQVLGCRVSDYIVPHRYRSAHDAGIRRLASGLREQPVGKWTELTALHSDGHEFPVELGMCVLEVDEAPLVGAFIRDITDHKNADAQNARLRRDLEHFSAFSLALNRAIGLDSLAKLLPSLFENLTSRGALLIRSNSPANAYSFDILCAWGNIEQREIDSATSVEIMTKVGATRKVYWGDRTSSLVLEVGDDVQGVLCLGNEAWRSLSETGIYSRSVIAHELALALQKAILHETIKTGQLELQRLSQRLMSVQEPNVNALHGSCTTRSGS